MTRKDYIAGLEEIRKQVTEIGKAFATVDLTDATDMESERRKKTTKLVADLRDRLYEDIAISAKVAADNAESGRGEQGDLFDAAREAQAAEDAEVVDVTTDTPAPVAMIEDKSGDKPSKGKKRGRKPSKKGGAK